MCKGVATAIQEWGVITLTWDLSQDHDVYQAPDMLKQSHARQLCRHSWATALDCATKLESKLSLYWARFVCTCYCNAHGISQQWSKSRHRSVKLSMPCKLMLVSHPCSCFVWYCYSAWSCEGNNACCTLLALPRGAQHAFGCFVAQN